MACDREPIKDNFPLPSADQIQGPYYSAPRLWTKKSDVSSIVWKAVEDEGISGKFTLSNILHILHNMHEATYDEHVTY